MPKTKKNIAEVSASVETPREMNTANPATVIPVPSNLLPPIANLNGRTATKTPARAYQTQNGDVHIVIPESAVSGSVVMTPSGSFMLAIAVQPSEILRFKGTVTVKDTKGVTHECGVQIGRMDGFTIPLTCKRVG